MNPTALSLREELQKAPAAFEAFLARFFHSSNRFTWI
jgi:hypothetical protein